MAQQQQAVGFSFRCDLCEDDHIGVPIIINPKHHYVVDAECASDMVAPLLERALANEFSYPAKWGKITIDYKNFLHLLPPGFQRDLRRRRVEYQTPVTQRIYCRAQRQKVPEGTLEQCGAFLGQKSSRPAQRRSGGAKVKSCRACDDPSYISCAHCGGLLSPDDLTPPSGLYIGRSAHRCATSSNDDDAKAFEGLVKGEDYQVCCSCGLRVQLMDGCNSLTCLSHSCRAQFCAICGKPARHNSNHWQLGKPCPRWNKPNDKNAGFDVPPEIDPGLDIPADLREWLQARRWLQAEEAGWRERAWNHGLVRDESYINRLLQLLTRNDKQLDELPFDMLNFGGHLPDDLNTFLFRRLLNLARQAVRDIAVYRGVGLHLTDEHLDILQKRYRKSFQRISISWGLGNKQVLLRFPRLVDILQRIIDQLSWLKGDINNRFLERAVGGNDIGLFDRADVPVIGDKLMREFLGAYHDLELTRLLMIRQRMPRPAGLGAAIDMTWLMVSNMRIPRLFLKATSSRQMHDLMLRFHNQHKELEVQREHVLDTLYPKTDAPPRAWERFVDDREDIWTKTSEAYDDAAEKFMALIPEVVVNHHRRGWYRDD